MKLLALLLGNAFAIQPVLAAEFKDHIFIQLESFKAPSIKMNVHDGKIIFRHYFGGHMLADSSFDYCLSNLPQEEFNQILSEIRDAGFFSWEEQYRNDDIRDGSFFRMTVSIDDEYHIVKGFNKYPPNFERIESAVNVLSEKYGCKK